MDYFLFNFSGVQFHYTMSRLVFSTEQLTLSIMFFIKRIVASEMSLTSLVKKADFPKDSKRLW